MKKEIKDKFPEWCNMKGEKYNLCLSDDIDSLFSCIILNQLFGYEIKWFYDFNNIYKDVDVDKKFQSIAIDADLINGRCWGNHVTLENEKAANLNTILNINKSNYTKKFAGSTLLTVLSYYNVNLNSLNSTQLEVLISIDTAFKQYFFNKELFKKYYNDILEYPMFTEILSKHDANYFYNIIKEYNLHESIYIKDGKLHTNIKLDKLGELFPDLSFILPQSEFKIHKSFEIVQSNYLKHNQEDIFSCARTYKNALRYSIK